MVRRLLLGVLVEVLAVGVAHAAVDDVILTGGVELCANGARFTVRAGDSTFGSPVYGQVFASDGETVLGSEMLAFAAPGDKHRVDVRLDGTFAPGTPVFLSISEIAGLAGGVHGDVLEASVEECSFVPNGDSESAAGWFTLGTVAQLNDTQFDYDGVPGDSHGLGTFWLLTTKVGGVLPTDGDQDGNGYDDYDQGFLTLSEPMHTKFACDFSFTFGFYSQEGAGFGSYDDFAFWRDAFSSFQEGVSYPNATSFTSTYPDTLPLDGISRTVSGAAGTINGATFAVGGRLYFDRFATTVAADSDFKIFFVVFDQRTQDSDSGLLVDELECVSRYLFNADFESGSTIEWDATQGEL